MPAVKAVRMVQEGANGLYRIRVPGRAGLAYVGQGLVRSRVGQHLRKVGYLQEPQGAVFRADMECSWVLNDAWYRHQRLELENDLIAAHVLWAGEPPPAQFMAGGERTEMLC
jgi:hypothetical protein